MQARLRLDGPEIQLRPKAALTMGMIIHELATNAVKHGALSVPDGKIEVTWGVEDVAGETGLVLRWAESGGPIVSKDGYEGFGTELLRRQVEHEWNGSVEQVFAQDGMRVVLRLPRTDQIYAKR